MDYREFCARATGAQADARAPGSLDGAFRLLAVGEAEPSAITRGIHLGERLVTATDDERDPPRAAIRAEPAKAHRQSEPKGTPDGSGRIGR